MKIAFVTFRGGTAQSGVLSKINNQVDCWIEMGNDVSVLCKSPLMSKVLYRNPIVIGYNSENKSISKRWITRLSKLSEIGKCLAQFKPDIIYYRYSSYRPFLFYYFKKTAPYVIEINSNDLSEFKLMGNVTYIINLIFRGVLLNGASGFFAVTKELAHLSIYKKYQKPTCVISNGIELSKKRILAPANNIRPSLVFSGSPNMSWHGVDKILKLAILTPEFDYHIIGYSKTDVSNRSFPINVKFHGYLVEDEYDKIIEMADIGIGTLALHRKKMEEACPLKVREYLAYGLPVIIGYKDTDLHKSLPFVLQIPNEERNVWRNIELIKKFVLKNKGIRVARCDVAPFIDIKKKEQQRLIFMSDILKKYSKVRK